MNFTEKYSMPHRKNGPFIEFNSYSCGRSLQFFPQNAETLRSVGLQQ